MDALVELKCMVNHESVYRVATEKDFSFWSTEIWSE